MGRSVLPPQVIVASIPAFHTNNIVVGGPTLVCPLPVMDSAHELPLFVNEGEPSLSPDFATSVGSQNGDELRKLLRVSRLSASIAALVPQGLPWHFPPSSNFTAVGPLAGALTQITHNYLLACNYLNDDICGIGDLVELIPTQPDHHASDPSLLIASSLSLPVPSLRPSKPVHFLSEPFISGSDPGRDSNLSILSRCHLHQDSEPQ